eukprot:gene1380-1590_t
MSDVQQQVSQENISKDKPISPTQQKRSDSPMSTGGLQHGKQQSPIQSHQGQQQQGLQGQQQGQQIEKPDRSVSPKNVHQESLSQGGKSLNDISPLIKGYKTCMITTRRRDGSLNSRMFRTQKRKNMNELWFVCNHDSTLEDLEHDNNVSVSYYINDSNQWVALNGTARAVKDKSHIQQAYNSEWRSLFDDLKDGTHDLSVNDPRYVLLFIDIDNYTYSKRQEASRPGRVMSSMVEKMKHPIESMKVMVQIAETTGAEQSNTRLPLVGAHSVIVGMAWKRATTSELWLGDYKWALSLRLKMVKEMKSRSDQVHLFPPATIITSLRVKGQADEEDNIFANHNQLESLNLDLLTSFTGDIMVFRTLKSRNIRVKSLDITIDMDETQQIGVHYDRILANSIQSLKIEAKGGCGEPLDEFKHVMRSVDRTMNLKSLSIKSDYLSERWYKEQYATKNNLESLPNIKLFHHMPYFGGGEIMVPLYDYLFDSVCSIPEIGVRCDPLLIKSITRKVIKSLTLEVENYRRGRRTIKRKPCSESFNRVEHLSITESRQESAEYSNIIYILRNNQKTKSIIYNYDEPTIEAKDQQHMTDLIDALNSNTTLSHFSITPSCYNLHPLYFQPLIHAINAHPTLYNKVPWIEFEK